MKLSWHLTSLLTRIVAMCGGAALGLSLGRLWYLQRLLSQARGAQAGSSEIVVGLMDYGGLLLFDLALAVILGVIVWSSYQRQLARPMSRLAEMIAQIQVNRREAAAAMATLSCAEVRELAQATISMLTRVDVLIAHCRDVGQRLGEAAHGAVAASTRHMSLLSEQVAACDEMAAALRDLAAAGRQSSAAGQDAADVAGHTLALAEQGQQAARNVAHSLTDIRQVFQSSAETMRALGKHSEPINDVVAAIDRMIADITLIAFNATIEAARGRDDGRGFGVVALEIKRVAEDVCESTEDIKEMIHDIQRASLLLAVGAEKDLHTVSRGTQRAEDASDALAHIVALATRTTAAAQRMASAAQQQSDVSEQSLHAAERVRHSVRRAAQEAQQFTTTAAELSMLAERIRQMLAGFGGE